MLYRFSESLYFVIIITKFFIVIYIFKYFRYY